PPRTDDADETLADFMRRRFGPEMLDKIGAPLLAGIYSGDVEHLSIMATFPRLRATEKQHGSLIRAARNNPPPAPTANSLPMFMSFRGGTGELTDALAAKLTGDLRLNCTVRQIKQTGDGYQITLMNAAPITASAVILTTPAFTAAKMLKDI